MPRYEQRRWHADLGAFGGRRSRKSFIYRAYVPDEIASSEFLLASDVVAALGEAERSVVELNAHPPVLGSLEAVARRLLRAESVASSRIEGLVISQRRLARAEFGGDDARDETAQSIVGNVRAMEEAIAVGANARRLTPTSVLRLHRILMEAGATPAIAGRLRAEQNWIGGGALSPRDAEFVPPPPEYVAPLLEDLCAYMERDDLPVIFQAAVAHAQFETIHPFADGNGRIGRSLIHVILRRRGLAPRFVPPVSLVLAGESKAYIRGLTAFRESKVSEWAGLFAAAVHTAANRASALASEIVGLQERWLEAAGCPRRDSSAAAIITLLPAHPLVTVATLEDLTGRSKQALNDAVSTLASAGVLKQITVGQRNRAWEAAGLFDLVNSFEHSLARPRPERQARRTR